jgi:hypothetical protein
LGAPGESASVEAKMLIMCLVGCVRRFSAKSEA